MREKIVNWIDNSMLFTRRGKVGFLTFLSIISVGVSIKTGNLAWGVFAVWLEIWVMFEVLDHVVSTQFQRLNRKLDAGNIEETETETETPDLQEVTSAVMENMDMPENLKDEVSEEQ